MPEIYIDNHWLFAGRFVVYVLGFVMIWSAVVDWLSYKKQKEPRAVRSLHVMIATGAIAVMLASPARYEVARRLFEWTPSESHINLLLFLGLVFACLSFIFAQVTRLRYKGASDRKIRMTVLTSLLGISLLALVGVGIDVRLP